MMVCLGNICRSPLAEGVLKHLVKKRGIHERFVIHSSGTADYHVGDAPDPRSCKVASMNGFELDHEGRHFRAHDFSNYDFILVMDESNYRDVISLAKTDEERAKVKLITDYASDQKYGKRVPDPYYGDLDDFIAVYEQLVHCCEGFLGNV